MNTETLTRLDIKTLEDLAQLSCEQLYTLYHQARTPKVEDLDGPLRGKMLAIPALQHPFVADFLHRFAGRRHFPWQGKTFQSLGEGKGEGINRVLGDRYDWFRFETFVGPSRTGDFEAVHLNYDLPENPAMIRKIKDEVREVAPGLWLGLAYMMGRDKANMALFFALTNQPASARDESTAESLVNKEAALKAIGLLISAVSLVVWLRKLGRRKK